VFRALDVALSSKITAAITVLAMAIKLELQAVKSLVSELHVWCSDQASRRCCVSS
jgi:hypothetical protein